MAKKYHNDVALPEEQRMIVKNVKRRLYDALNVMIAAGIIDKRSNGGLRLNSKHAQLMKNVKKRQNTE